MRHARSRYVQSSLQQLIGAVEELEVAINIEGVSASPQFFADESQDALKFKEMLW